jgi:hypothetical protein
VKKHPSTERSRAQNPRSEYEVIFPKGNHARHGSDQPGRILIIRVQHDDDVRAPAQGFAIAGFLVTPVPKVLMVNEGGQV